MIKDGFYWIKACPGYDYEIALVQNDGVFFVGSDMPDKLSDMAAIGDYIPMPSKYESPS